MSDAPRRRLEKPEAVVTLPASAPPILFIVVDTEEEFDWSAPFSRDNTGVTAMRYIGRAQSIFERYGLKPTYVVDYPVAHQPDGSAPLRELLEDDRCTVGAHLHPWVTPPFDEDVSSRSSFGSNLPVDLEAAKIRVLRDEIHQVFGVAPKAYKAGRYGLDARGAETLEALGFDVDMSVNPHMDFSEQGGPSFAAFDSSPFFLDQRRDGLFFLPCTVGFVGLAGAPGKWLHAIASTKALEPLHAVGMLARSGVTNRVMLSPEGNTLSEMKALAQALCARGLRTFSLTFHSPSVEPGHTPYVRTEADLREFLDCLDGFCEFFFRELDGVGGRPLDFRSSLVKESSR
jgi:hypothetical protein